MKENEMKLNLITDIEFENKVKKGLQDFQIAIENNSEILNLISKNILLNYNIVSNEKVKITSIGFDKNFFNIFFSFDESINKEIYNSFLKNEATCEEDAKLNYLKYKLNRFFLIPIDFEIKIRSFDTYREYLMSNLKKAIKAQMYFDMNKNKWDYDNTLFSYFNIFKKHIRDLSVEKLDEEINKK